MWVVNGSFARAAFWLCNARFRSHFGKTDQLSGSAVFAELYLQVTTTYAAVLTQTAKEEAVEQIFVVKDVKCKTVCVLLIIFGARVRGVFRWITGCHLHS